MFGELSTPTTWQPRSTSTRVSGRPLPQPTSSTEALRGRADRSSVSSGTPVASVRCDAYHSAIKSYSCTWADLRRRYGRYNRGRRSAEARHDTSVRGPCCLSAMAGVLEAQTQPDFQVTRAAQPPVIDGALNDEVWQREALPLGEWLSYQPNRGDKMPAELRTEVKIAYDDRNIYLAIHCFDNEPAKIRTTISKRDSAFNDDWIAMSLDSAGTGQTAYHLFVNPSGVQMDAINTSASGEQFDADVVWYSVGKVVDDGYVVEIQLPLQTLRFSSGDQVRMGLVFFRKISRMGVSYSWPADAAGPMGLRSTGAPAVRQPDAAAARRAAAERDLRRQSGSRAPPNGGTPPTAIPTSARAESSASPPTSRSTAPSIPTSARSKATRSRSRSTSAFRSSIRRSVPSSWKAWDSSTSPAPAGRATCGRRCTRAASRIRSGAPS